MPERIALLGSTGSIGTQALDIISKYPDKFQLLRSLLQEIILIFLLNRLISFNLTQLSLQTRIIIIC